MRRTAPRTSFSAGRSRPLLGPPRLRTVLRPSFRRAVVSTPLSLIARSATQGPRALRATTETSDLSIGSPKSKLSVRIATAVSRSATHAPASTEGMICIIDSAGHMPMRTDSIQCPRPEVKHFDRCSLHFGNYTVTRCISRTYAISPNSLPHVENRRKQIALGGHTPQPQALEKF